jgi:hypothetical protein
MTRSWLLAACLVACAGAREPRPEPASQPATSAAPSAPLASAAPPASASAAAAPVASAPRPFPGVDCADAAAAPNLRHIACENECRAGSAESCETLGDLHAKEEGLPEPKHSSGLALRAWHEACERGASSACQKRDALRASLATACRKKPGETCVIEGKALLELPGERNEEALVYLTKACDAGFADGCFEVGELHTGWEPDAVHQPLAERAYVKACRLGSAGGCCSALSIYEATGDRQKFAAITRASAGILGFGCGRGGPPRPSPAPRGVEAKLSGENFSADERTMIERFFKSRGSYCFQQQLQRASWKGRVTVALELAPEGRALSAEAMSSKNAPPDLLVCLRSMGLRLVLPASPIARRATVELKLRPEP